MIMVALFWRLNNSFRRFVCPRLTRQIGRKWTPREWYVASYNLRELNRDAMPAWNRERGTWRRTTWESRTETRCLPETESVVRGVVQLERVEQRCDASMRCDACLKQREWYVASYNLRESNRDAMPAWNRERGTWRRTTWESRTEMRCLPETENVVRGVVQLERVEQRCDASMRCDAMRWDAVRCGAMRCIRDAMRCTNPCTYPGVFIQVDPTGLLSTWNDLTHVAVSRQLGIKFVLIC